MTSLSDVPVQRNEAHRRAGLPYADLAESVELCTECHDPVMIQIFKGTGLCSELCRKLHKGEITPDEWDERRKQRVQGV